MKKLFVIKLFMVVLFYVVCVTMSSCIKTDDRDQFIGEYSLNATGSYSLTINGETYTMPISGNGVNLSIEKSSVTENTVFVTGYYSAEALVMGNSIEIDSETVTDTQDGATITMTLTHNRGTLSGGTLSFISNITGNYYYQGYSFPIHGNISNIAYKKSSSK